MAPNILRDRTILYLARHIAGNMSLSKIRELFVELELSSFDEIDELWRVLKSKNKVLIELLRKVNRDMDESNLYKLLQRTIKGADSELLQALQLEGWDLSEFGIIPLAGHLAEPSAEESVLRDKLSNHGMTEVAMFMEESYDNYTRDNFEAANAMTRTALESLVKLIAETVVTSRRETIPQSGSSGCQPRDYRNYLRDIGFLDDNEHRLLSIFYSYASQDGPHPGLSNRTDARLRRFMMVGLCLFYLEKLESKNW